ncbi:MAG: DUF1926 domain-containing protein [Blastochloris sp.]|nr:DUF1926 domain-containing protein [Blastochloris sp.]
MMRGALFRFTGRGSWGGFRRRYTESNLMEKKGLWLQRWMHEENLEDSEVRQLLWQAQCNTAYWHGSSGGIYLPHLREAIWARLLQAQEALSEMLDGFKEEIEDLDADGREEVVVHNQEFSYGIAPAQGGVCYEWSLLPPKVNLGNTLTRRLESGWDQEEEKGAERRQVLDGQERHIFMDRFLERHVSTEELAEGRYRELGDFAGQPYKLVQTVKRAESYEVTLERLGAVWVGNAAQPVHLTKRYRWSTDLRCLQVSWVLKNVSPIPFATVLATELNLGLPVGPGEGRTYRLSGLEERRRGLAELWYEGQAGGAGD